MSRKKKSPTPIMVESNTRLAGLRSIAENLDLGNDLTNENFNNLINQIYEVMERYNMLQSQSDQVSNEFDVLQKLLKNMNERMLLGVAVKYGKDSDEYEMAGGTRKSERKKPTRKKNDDTE